MRRLRQPKYLFGAAVGAAYFWFFFFRPSAFTVQGPTGADPLAAHHADSLPLIFVFGGFALYAAFRVLAAWIAPSNKPGLAFSEAEVAFLFPAPLTRRSLVHYKLLNSQFTILLQSLLLTLISSRWSFLGGNAFTQAVGWWVIFSTLNLHTIGAAFTVTRLIEAGVSKTARQAGVIGVAVLAAIVFAGAIWRTVPSPTTADLATAGALLQYLVRLTETGLLGALLWPAKLVVRPFLAANSSEFLAALAPALLILASHYAWVLRAETSFEEGSIALAEKRAATIAALHAGNYRLGHASPKARREPFRLAPSGGRPELAFLWKNLLSTRPYFTPRVALMLAATIIVGSLWLARGSEVQRAVLSSAGAFASMLAGYTVLLGPQFARQDLRSDLAHADILKTYPLRGWQVMLGELLTPVAILTVILWLALLAATLALSAIPVRTLWLAPSFRLTATACLALVLPLLCMLQLMVPNAATLLFPSWTQLARTRERGLDVMGQRLIFVAGQLFAIGLALLPAIVLGLLLWFAARWACGEAVSMMIATLGVLGVLLSEIWLGLLWLGRRFEKFDLSVETMR